MASRITGRITADGREYLTVLPSSVPAGKWLVHNHAVPARRLGTRGFRAWLIDAGDERLGLCACDWAPELGHHYEVDPGRAGGA